MTDSAVKRFQAVTSADIGSATISHWVGVVLFRRNRNRKSGIEVLIPNRKIDPSVPWAHYEAPCVNFDDGCVGKKVAFPEGTEEHYLLQTLGETLNVFAGETVWECLCRAVREEGGAFGAVTFFDARGEKFSASAFEENTLPWHIAGERYDSRFGMHRVPLLTTYPAGNAPNFWFGQVALAKLSPNEMIVDANPDDHEITERKWWDLDDLIAKLEATPEQFFGLHYGPLCHYTRILKQGWAK